MSNNRYYVVDKETGEVVGETNDRHPFKRLLAFVVLYLLSLVTRFVTYWYITLVLRLLGRIYDLSRLAYYLVLFFGGTTALGLLVGGFMLGSHLMTTLPEKIIPSRKGLRYMVLGIGVASFYLISLISMLAGFGSSRTAVQYVWHIIVIIFFTVFAFIGKGIAQDG